MFDEPHHSFSDHLKKTLETERRYFTDEENARGVQEE